MSKHVDKQLCITELQLKVIKSMWHDQRYSQLDICAAASDGKNKISIHQLRRAKIVFNLGNRLPKCGPKMLARPNKYNFKS